MNCPRKHFYLENYYLVSVHKFTKGVTYILTLFFFVFFVPMILKILLYNINDKHPTNYEMRCEL